MKRFFALFAPLALAGCSVFGQSDVETAPYELVEAVADKNIEVRNYPSLILVSTPMNAGENSAFRRLFNYISGANKGSEEIAMTAPVFMNEGAEREKDGEKIAMTAPVFMGQGEQNMMSFVMPSHFTVQTTPQPSNPDVRISEVTDYKVAVITFSGTLSESNVRENTQKLNAWLASSNYTATGPAIEAAYNGPMTLPVFRRNEIMVPVK
ncbi:SOUL heme-binding protein [Idiomarina aquatica]|uniref:SOUL heme-binding protein n=1 Tax=Idiomarina aquatica TaxID=1327752 RepID=A0A4R6P0C8_9GAMM|nr:heme-binding protein [Idiomarina aquatica]TDP29447.1 SOUL heme-binding protein [Idiomarina aquatica]